MFRIPTVKAHCDIPCKIYDPTVAQIASISIVRLMDLMAEVSGGGGTDEIAQISRLTSQKEIHAAEVKHEVVTIWGDYFKDPQISKHPEIHELTHSIMQLASKCKQEIDRNNGVELLKKVNKFTEIFWETKNVETQKFYAPYPPELVIVCPVLKSV